MIKIISLVLFTGFLLVVTIVGAKEKRRWAWARFLAFEANLVLILLNLGRWFEDPFKPLQIISWVLLAASLYAVLHGVLFLQFRGRPDGYFERTTRLVTGGIYGFIRHPMYASLIYLAWGAWLKNPGPTTFGLAALATAASWLTAKTEESDNHLKFGREYSEYVKKTKMFVPYVI
jgi:protein-S-isoprenylcysteine O-methyltransferase Ste14